VISKKTIIAGIFSTIIGVGMLAMPVRAMAHDWNHGGGWGHGKGAWGRGHRDNGNHFGWYNHGPQNNGWYNRGGDGDEGYRGSGYYGQPNYGYGYGGGDGDEDDGGGYGNGYGYGGGYGNYGGGYGRAFGGAMVNPRHPGLMWACDSQGHHCHWAQRPGYGYGQAGLNPLGGYYGNNGYGYNGYGNGYSPLGGLGSLFGLPIP
jgi:hypothetical protein